MLDNTIPLVEVSGSPREMGGARGEQLPDLIRQRVDRVLALGAQRRGLARLASRAGQVEATLESQLPDMLEEMHGIAEAAGVPFDHYRMAALGAPPRSAQGECSALAIRAPDGRISIGKNNDLYAPDWQRGDVVVVRARPRTGARYLALSCLPELPGGIDWMSDHLITVGAGVSLSRRSDSISRVPTYLLVAAAATVARSLSDAIRVMGTPKGASTGRNLLSTDGSSVIHLELGRDVCEARIVEGTTEVVTNHYTSPGTREAGARPTRSSRRRRRRALQLASNPAQTIRAVLTDHEFGYSGDSICRHGRRWRTWASMEFDLEKRAMAATLGNPCESGCRYFSLD